MDTIVAIGAVGGERMLDRISSCIHRTAPTTNEEEERTRRSRRLPALPSNQAVPDWGLLLATLPVGTTSYADSGLAVADYY